METDKALVAYALTLVTGTAAVLTLALSANFAMAPSPLMFLEHVALGIALRGAYKWAYGFETSDWIPSFRMPPVQPETPPESAIPDNSSDEERLAA